MGGRDEPAPNLRLTCLFTSHSWSTCVSRSGSSKKQIDARPRSSYQDQEGISCVIDLIEATLVRKNRERRRLDESNLENNVIVRESDKTSRVLKPKSRSHKIPLKISPLAERTQHEKRSLCMNAGMGSRLQQLGGSSLRYAPTC